MKQEYLDNQEISIFTAKAQNKIADLATTVVNRGGQVSPQLLLALELIDYIESLDNEYCEWEVDEVVKWCQEYSYRANLNELAYLNLLDFTTNIIAGDGFGIITVSQIEDFEDEVLNILKSFPHNNLAAIQGGTPTQRYHVDKAMYDYLYNLVHPFIPNTVKLEVSTNRQPSPYGFYELGTSINLTQLTGSIAYNSDKQANYFEYTKDNALLGSRNTSLSKEEQPNVYTYSSLINKDTTFSFNAMFNSGLLSDSKSLLFKQPMYYGLIRKDQYNNTTLMQTKTQIVRDKGSMSLVFTIPDNNTTITDESYLVPFVFIPGSWGFFTHATVLAFDYITDWKYFSGNMTLADGTSMPGIYAYYNNQSEGVITFNFSY